jgi:hypothetical protein
MHRPARGFAPVKSVFWIRAEMSNAPLRLTSRSERCDLVRLWLHWVATRGYAISAITAISRVSRDCIVIALQGFTWKTSVKAADALEASVVSVQFTEPVAPAGGFVQGKITRIEQKLRGES